MGQPVRRRKGPDTPTSPPATPRLRPASTAQDTDDIARRIAEQFGRLPASARELEVTAKVKHRAPHEMLGRDGYSLVSNYFLRRVLPYCLMHNVISKLQAAVLSNFIGRAEKGKFQATQAETAEEIGVGRTSVGPAIEQLCRLNLLRQIRRSVYELNPRVAFNGNGDEQNEFLTRLRGLKLESKFPDDLPSEMTLFSVADTA